MKLVEARFGETRIFPRSAVPKPSFINGDGEVEESRFEVDFHISLDE